VTTVYPGDETSFGLDGGASFHLGFPGRTDDNYRGKNSHDFMKFGSEFHKKMKIGAIYKEISKFISINLDFTCNSLKLPLTYSTGGDKEKE
jgi:hypothetical protein